ncbi:Cholinesterase [Mycena indigotica]|uniref:Carboxylic ester hydrolase n=1 Tax=Mycena indigotica TaxID=2126181 RepID=A0A8H6W333_9AGAR|nr:Cholinesterase [Mycena indigotica]KAF7303809.1 Cholinesterase [Mycena indigotica]
MSGRSAGLQAGNSPSSINTANLDWLAAQAASSPTTIGSDLWLLFQNDLNWPTVAEHESSILLSPHTHSDALAACAKLNEGLTPINGSFFTADISKLLTYASLETGNPLSQHYWVDGSRQCTAISVAGRSALPCATKLPTLCANSAPNKVSGQTDLSPTWQVQVNAGKLTATGTRDHLSFRFLGIPYADKPERWTYSSLYTGPPQISALKFGSPCSQTGNPPTGAEDCLFLNVFTPFLPGPTHTGSKHKPVMFWIHGGAFTNGEGSDAIFDGGNLASRADVVVVTFNYRLGALGFLALNDGVTNGNFGLGDQITALHWVQEHISSFGGDPTRVTILGQSAGAGSVRALLGSPPAIGLFSGAIAESNLAGFAYAHTYSEYFTIEQEVETAAAAFLNDVHCGNVTSDQVLDCLKAVPWQTLQTAANAPRYPVVDGKILVRDRLSVDGKGPVNSAAHVMFGWMAGDGVDFAGSYPKSGTTQLASVQGIGIAANLSSTALSSGLFPRPSTGNDTLDTFNVTGRIATDGEFSCLDQATAHSAAIHKVFKSMWTYQFERSYMGYEPIPGLCDPPVTETHPFGDPSLPYFQCHSGELYFTFGTLGQDLRPFRDEFDLPFEQVMVDSWASFARSFNPNPSAAFLAARGYTTTAKALAQWGPWKDVTSKEPVRILAWPSRGSDWLEQPQCNVLGFPLDFYEKQ